MCASEVVSAAGSCPCFGEWAAIEQAKWYGDGDQEGFVERSGDRWEAECYQPSEWLRDAVVGCGDPDRMNRVSEEREGCLHALSVGGSASLWERSSSPRYG